MLSAPLKRIVLWSLILFLLFCSLPVWAGEGVVKGSVVNVRQSPGTTYKVVTQVKAGQNITILAESGDWLQIRTNNGQEGWIHKTLVETTAANVKKVVVNGSNANVRKGPGTNFTRVGQVQQGDILTVSGEKDGWYKVEAPGIGQVWIAGWLTTPQQIVSGVSQGSSATVSDSVPFAKVNVKVLNVRSGPGTQYSITTKIGLNESHDIVGEKEDWVNIKVGNQLGWVSKEHVVIDSRSKGLDQGPSIPTNGQQYVIVIGNNVNVRQQGNLDSNVITQVTRGDRLSIISRQGDWYQVSLPDGKKGWIAGWLTEQIAPAPNSPSRGALQGSEVLIAPIAEGKTFKVIDYGGRPSLALEGWNTEEYTIRTEGNTNTLVIELKGPTERNYEGQISRLGINNVKIVPQGDKAIIKLDFSFSPTHSVKFDSQLMTTLISFGGTMPSQGGLGGKVIVVDPGHASIQPGGWLDPGAIGPKTGLQEKDVNLSIALSVKRHLESAGARVIMTHSGRTDLSLADRAAVANNLGADIFVSIHSNSSVRGIYSGHSTYYYAPPSNPLLAPQRYSRQKLASLVQREMVKVGGRMDLGIKEDNFAVLRETRVPSILVETAFISDREEEILLGDEIYRQQLAVGIFRGIEAYFSK